MWGLLSWELTPWEDTASSRCLTELAPSKKGSVRMGYHNTSLEVMGLQHTHQYVPPVLGCGGCVQKYTGT